MSGLAFDAPLEPTPRGGGGAIVRLPANAADVFGTRARFPVKATFNGIAYRGSTMPMGDGTFCIGVRKDIQAEAEVTLGDTIHVVIERDVQERVVDVPAELSTVLAADEEAREFFDGLAYTHRREYARWVAEAKRPETRDRRAAEALEMLRAKRTRSM